MKLFKTVSTRINAAAADNVARALEKAGVPVHDLNFGDSPGRPKRQRTDVTLDHLKATLKKTQDFHAYFQHTGLSSVGFPENLVIVVVRT